MNFNKIYIIDFRILITWLLPTFLRGVIHIEWLDTLCNPIKEVYESFLKYRSRVNYKLSHNSQVCYLQAALNDTFDAQQRRIRIRNGIFLQALYVYTDQEQRPVYLGSEFIYTDEDLISGSSDFVLRIPSELKPIGAIALEGLENDIKALTNEYKLASKTYNIQWIE
ncbi:hypothetical protein [Pseudotenacibaculum haliotis]|uniref:Uncharacterized protein n=1 Tax=Pseudotenacibaculum haliotis TaxID=1862138 RepID=A0ABW5LN24_9FLAO